MEHHFNHKAESFDSPKNIFIADLIRQEVEKQIVDFSDKRILDFGGGTGLVTLPLAAQSKLVMLVDISDKMLDQARLKVEKQAIDNVYLLQQDLLTNPLNQLFDIIVVSRVLHHMPNVEKTLAMFRNHLVEDGQLFIADFVKTDVNHHGFHLDELEENLSQNGFLPVKSQIIYSAEELFLGNYAELFLTLAQKSLVCMMSDFGLSL